MEGRNCFLAYLFSLGSAVAHFLFFILRYYLPDILLGNLSLLFLLIFKESHIIEKEANVLVLRALI